MASGTDALQLIFRALGIGAGDEVIVPAFTFVATALGRNLAGATPVLVDVNRDDGSDRSGKDRGRNHPAHQGNYRRPFIRPLRRHRMAFGKLPIAAESACDRRCLPGPRREIQRQGGRIVGHGGGFQLLSGKNLGAYGDGGAITTNDSALATRLQLMRNWGSIRKYHHEEVGLNSRLDSLQAAALDVKLKYLPRWNQQRREHAAAYDLALADQQIVPKFPAAHGGESVYHLYVVRVKDRDARLAWLNSQGVGAGIHYPFPLHQLRAFQLMGRCCGSLSEAEAWANECLSLPIYPELSTHERDFVISTLVRKQQKMAA